MKKLFTYLLVLTFACVLAACNNLPAPQVQVPEKQEEPQKNEDDPKDEVKEDDEKLDEEQDKNKDDQENMKSKENNGKDNEDKRKTNTNDADLAEAFQDYINEISLLGPEEIRIIDAYGSVSGENYVNDSIMYEVLYNDVVPSYTEFVLALESIESDNEIVQDLHAIYVEAAKIQLGAFTVMISALEEQSTDLVELANQGLNESSALILEWQAQVQILSVETGIGF